MKIKRADIDYWIEASAEALEEAGISANSEQIEKIAEYMSISHDNYGMAFYQPSCVGYHEKEINDLKAQLKKEREKVHCKECNGRGRIISNCGTFTSDSECWICHGEGRYNR